MTVYYRPECIDQFMTKIRDEVINPSTNNGAFLVQAYQELERLCAENLGWEPMIANPPYPTVLIHVDPPFGVES